MKDFKGHYNLLLIDLKGHGGSVDYKLELLTYTPKELADDLVNVLDSLSIKNQPRFCSVT